MAVLYMPNGVNTSAWSPQGSGRDITWSPTLEPLRDLKDQVVVLSNLADADTGIVADHIADFYLNTGAHSASEP